MERTEPPAAPPVSAQGGARWWGTFLAVQVAAALLVFGDALWGGSLLAPLDIAPALFSKFGWLDPDVAATGVPANHHNIDQLTYDLPAQFTLHQALRRGALPRWDPYTLGGWPLLADGHTNATDPLRLAVFALLPFETAYNWTYVLRFALAGLGAALLLRRWGCGAGASVLLATAYGYAGCFFLFVQGPWVQSALLYYPFLWLVWESAVDDRSRLAGPAAALLVAAVILAGSVQSHTYLFLFALAFLCGYAGREGAAWRRCLPVVAGSGVLGALLTAPVWMAQIELFLRSDRMVALDWPWLGWLAGPGSLAAAYPWGLGSFRTLDVGKFIGQNSLGFHLFFGSAGFALAVLGLAWRPPRPALVRPWRMGLALVVIYLLIVSTPLVKLFYPRCAGLAVLGLVVLAACGLERAGEAARDVRRAGRWLLGGALAVAVLVNVAALVVYPRLRPAVERLVTERDRRNPSLETAPQLRAFQVGNLPAEVSFLNPRATLAWAGLLLLAACLLRPEWRAAPGAWALLLALNLLPVLLTARQYVSRAPAAQWQRLLAGGPEQQRVMAALQDQPTRLWEQAPGAFDQVMPLGLAQLYRVRVVQGYSSLPPHCLLTLSEAERSAQLPRLADWIYESRARGQSAGELRTNATPGWARFQWLAASPRAVTVTAESAVKTRLHLTDGPAAELLWTDTWHPGWRAESAGQPLALTRMEPCFTRVSVPAGARTLILRYDPHYLGTGRLLAGAGGGACVVWWFCLARRRRAREIVASPCPG